MTSKLLPLDPNVTIPLVLRLSVLQHLTVLADEKGVSRSALIREAVLLLGGATNAPTSVGAQGGTR